MNKDNQSAGDLETRVSALESIASVRAVGPSCARTDVIQTRAGTSHMAV